MYVLHAENCRFIAPISGTRYRHLLRVKWCAASTTSAKNVLGLARQTIAQRHRDLDLAVKECLGDATNASNEREGEPIMTTTHDDTATSWRDLADQLTPQQTKSLDKI